MQMEGDVNADGGGCECRWRVVSDDLRRHERRLAWWCIFRDTFRCLLPPFQSRVSPSRCYAAATRAAAHFPVELKGHGCANPNPSDARSAHRKTTSSHHGICRKQSRLCMVPRAQARRSRRQRQAPRATFLLRCSQDSSGLRLCLQ
jgi:hypothetical protein